MCGATHSISFHVRLHGVDTDNVPFFILVVYLLPFQWLAKSEVSTVANIQTTVCWNVTPYILVDKYERIGEKLLPP